MAAEVVPCGSLYCQKNCYSCQLTSQVVSCSPGEGGEYEIVLADTVLFPEGGGQVRSSENNNYLRAQFISQFTYQLFYSLA